MVERIFKAVDRHGNVCDFELKTPGLAEENEGERHYRVAYSKCLVEGIFPREKLREVMRQHDMWTEGDESEFKKVVGQIAIYQIELRQAETEGDNKKCIDISKQIVETRKRMWELFLIQQSVYMNSAEGVSEVIKTESMMAACVINKATGKRYWKDYSEYVMERDLNTTSTVYAKVVDVQTTIFDEARDGLMSGYPEHKYLKSVEDRVLDREVQEQIVKELKSRAEKAIEKEEEKSGEVDSKANRSRKGRPRRVKSSS